MIFHFTSVFLTSAARGLSSHDFPSRHLLLVLTSDHFPISRSIRRGHGFGRHGKTPLELQKLRHEYFRHV
jgi:hypothetical protein